jgi:hypothetical protein
MEVLPPEDGLPLWQLAQVLAVGFDALNEPAPPGNANAVGTFSCAPNSMRRARIPVNRKNIAGRNLFTRITPWSKFLIGQRADLNGQACVRVRDEPIPLIPKPRRLHRPFPQRRS